ncbi:MAG: hypothetical protein DDT40_00420 [candidate division WS2 bacterium]|uniref:Uncharacterized protein n=1 Tax=Psychracetigena formicireducens TaxID=2986056 RepID=A0A9E2BG71_PSYF1|nr:hypothetical protein [Candidatus Psychracetigena formicireducens]MBT9145010.1 hypothetical protein [Candidatus Psychracetigena formicireducens]MBT9150252.1 hypothetical protein [Candidatus Psychracetigena formicireducens]
MRALIVLSPNESKRIIARGVASLPEIKNALKNSIIHISRGTTNAYIYEELTGKTVDKNSFVAGFIGDGKLNVLPPEERLKSITINQGKILEMEPQEILQEMSVGDIFIKGGNAIDINGTVGVLCANREGGTIGMAIGPVIARGIKLITPLSLSKLVPSVSEGSEEGGIDSCDQAMGLKVALFPVTTATVITEIEALRLLYGIEAVLIAQSGIKDMESALVFSIKGESDNIKKAIQDIEEIKKNS